MTRHNGKPANLRTAAKRKGTNRFVYMLTSVLEAKYRTDAEAAADIYGVEPTHPKYRKLKSRVKEHLVRSLFSLQIQSPRNSTVVVSFYNCITNATCARILVLLGARNMGVALAHKTLLKAQEAHLFDIVLQCAKLLRSHYSLVGLEKQFLQYNDIVMAMIRIQEAELESERLLEHLMVKYARSTSKKGEFEGLAASSLTLLGQIKEQYPTYTVMMNYFRVKSLYYQIARDFYATISACEEAEEYYQKYPQFATKQRLAELALVKMVAFLHLRDYARGSQNAQRCLELYTPGSNNWLAFMEYYFLLALHSHNFKEAVGIFRDVSMHPRFQIIPEFKQEIWRVNEGYLNYIFESGWEETLSDEVDMLRKRFNVHKFLNEVPVFSKDKRGMNVSILILQILFLLERGQLDAIASRTDALRVYSSRYLRRDENYRSELFIRMLLTMESKSFDYKKTLVATQGYHTRLLATAQGKHGSLDGTEVIPFELLWDRILLKLKKGVGMYIA